MSASEILQTCLIAGGLIALLALALEFGFRAGRSRAAADGSSGAGAQLSAVQGATLGLLGLLLAFSFAAAGGRFLERQDLIVEEANAIGTAFLRADLLDEPHKSQLRDALRRYTEHRIEVSSRLRQGVREADATAIDRFHTEIWTAAIGGVAAQPATMLGVLPPVNDVIDLHSTRLGAGRKKLPWLVMGLLIACSVVSVGVIGYGAGITGRRAAPLTVSLLMLIATSLWVTIDLDNPRAGILRLNDAPLRALKFDPPPS